MKIKDWLIRNKILVAFLLLIIASNVFVFMSLNEDQRDDVQVVTKLPNGSTTISNSSDFSVNGDVVVQKVTSVSGSSETTYKVVEKNSGDQGKISVNTEECPT